MPWLLLAGVGAAIWYFTKGGTDKDEIQRTYQYALQNESDPGILREFAMKLREAGMTNEAMALEAKALATGAIGSLPRGTSTPMNFIVPQQQPIAMKRAIHVASGPVVALDRIPGSAIPHDRSYRNGDWEMR